MTSVSMFQTQMGLRLSITYCEIEDGVVVKDNIRINRILTEAADIQKGEDLLTLAQSFLEGE